MQIIFIKLERFFDEIKIRHKMKSVYILNHFKSVNKKCKLEVLDLEWYTTFLTLIH